MRVAALERGYHALARRLEIVENRKVPSPDTVVSVARDSAALFLEDLSSLAGSMASTRSRGTSRYNNPIFSKAYRDAVKQE
ncbi:MAG: hypothetical protein Q9191_008579 [Dirinaria sp. TL-2023a]